MKTPVPELPLIKLLVSANNLIKTEVLARVFSCEFWDIFKNNFLKVNLRAPASKNK